MTKAKSLYESLPASVQKDDVKSPVDAILRNAAIRTSKEKPELIPKMKAGLTSEQMVTEFNKMRSVLNQILERIE